MRVFAEGSHEMSVFITILKVSTPQHQQLSAYIAFK